MGRKGTSCFFLFSFSFSFNEGRQSEAFVRSSLCCRLSSDLACPNCNWPPARQPKETHPTSPRQKLYRSRSLPKWVGKKGLYSLPTQIVDASDAPETCKLVVNAWKHSVVCILVVAFHKAKCPSGNLCFHKHRLSNSWKTRVLCRV